jgi:hypothetical protein
MAIERVYICDWHDCENHARTASDSLPVSMIGVTEGTGRPQHFCSWDCLLKYAATKPPSEAFPLGETYS